LNPIYILQGMNGRPGPLGPRGGKGEQVWNLSNSFVCLVIDIVM